MSFLKSLFGGKPANDQGGKVLDEEDYKGFKIRAMDMRAGSEYQLCGEISKQVGEETRVHKFIRADRTASVEQAGSLALAKGRQIIDEQGDRLFS